MNPPVIGLTGAAGAGKDSVHEILFDRGYHVTKVSLATPIKRAIAAMVRETMAIFERPFKDQPMKSLGGMSPREALIVMGMAYRDRDPDYWLNMARCTIEANLTQVPNVLRPVVIVTDVRFPNEVDMVRSFGGFVVQVLRPDNPYQRVDHISEQHSLDADWHLVNAGTYNSFAVSVRAMADAMHVPARARTREGVLNSRRGGVA